MRSPDWSCRYYIQDVFFWRLAGPVAPTGKAIVYWIGCINAINITILISWLRIAGKVGWESPCPLGKVLTYKNLIYY